MSDIHYISEDCGRDIRLAADGSLGGWKNEWPTLCGTWADYQQTAFVWQGLRTVTCMGCILVNLEDQAQSSEDSHG